MNIYSGSGGLASALTNPTELAFRKGCLVEHYPVTFRGVTYPDAEAAYQRLKVHDVAMDDYMMAEVIAAKLRQHSRLNNCIRKRGGETFLATCSHFTYAHSDVWHGMGTGSRFIRCLIEGYRRANT
jgi:hypothetical protein